MTGMIQFKTETHDETVEDVAQGSRNRSFLNEDKGALT